MGELCALFVPFQLSTKNMLKEESNLEVASFQCLLSYPSEVEALVHIIQYVRMPKSLAGGEQGRST